MELGLNTSIDTSAVSLKSKVETPKVLSPLTETKENNINVFEDFNKLSSLKEGSLKVKTISLSSDEAKKVGLGTLTKVGLTAGGTVAGIIAGARLGIEINKDLHIVSPPEATLVFVGSVGVGALVTGVTSAVLASKIKLNEKTDHTITRVGLTSGGTVAGIVSGGFLGAKVAKSCAPDPGVAALIFGASLIVGGIAGGVTTNVLANKVIK